MTYLPEDLAPGCYGSALAFKADAPACVSCVFAAQCQPLHVENLAKFREHLGISEKTPRNAGKKPKAVKAPAVTTQMAISPEALKLAEHVEKRGLRITEKMAAGENPFVGQGLPFLQLASALLIKRQHINRGLLIAAFITKLGFDEVKAQRYARHAESILSYVGAISVAEQTLSIRSR